MLTRTMSFCGGMKIDAAALYGRDQAIRMKSNVNTTY